MLSLCLCDNVPLTSFGKVWTLRDTAHRGLKAKGKHLLSVSPLGTSRNDGYSVVPMFVTSSGPSQPHDWGPVTTGLSSPWRS